MDNMHALSSLFTFIVWGIFGAFIALAIIKTKRNRVGRLKLISGFVLLALFSGVLVTLNNGLPEYGFDLENSKYVAAITAIFAIPLVKIKSRRVNKPKYANTDISLYSSQLKGGVS